MGRSLLLDKNTGHYRQPESLGKQAEGITNRGKTSTPGSPLTSFNDGGRRGGGVGGSDRGSYFIPKKITSSEFVYPKKSLSPFFATQKIPLFFFPTQINHGVLGRPKTVTFGQNFRPKKITRAPLPPPSPPPLLPVIKICECGPWDWYVSNCFFTEVIKLLSATRSRLQQSVTVRFYSYTVIEHTSTPASVTCTRLEHTEPNGSNQRLMLKKKVKYKDNEF